ncbi:uncharacterized protein MYCFIDRAFT_176995 [Pseudocercospora fijiensis CIRAD86]|uniref:Uncharacterized protein n=1 Tax=Pseudocercospora fijiensis (strain CIRAD86) TaxID=383855 RepID=M3AS77_PSEFD|nr:uncharacterized protein MYCFIDRAFT_176995 [Pseudocercospora fijiensis CIRAD86]EME80003.1 hypothetical protein MYCFIDRAFT_176995 [Pseudocercospora fijiensis CIRAD86]
MGRRQFLTRLALGRSAFEADVEEPTGSNESRGNSATVQDDGTTQQYDGKGRQVNPEIDAFNAEMRKAQNEVLALVGVVERKDHVDQVNELRFKYIHKHRQELLHEEHERGDLLEYVFIPVRFFSHLWTDAFRQRIQIGYYDSSRTMAEILSTEWAAMWRGGTKWSLATRFPALGDTIAHICVRIPLLLVGEQLTGTMQNAVLRRKGITRKTRQNMYTAINVLFESLALGIDIFLLPMEFHACAQQLGLAPVLPLFPSWTTFIPWHPDSFHKFGWKPLANLGILSSLTSPAVLLLFHKLIHYDIVDYDIPIFSLLTDFRYPPITEEVRDVPVPKRLDIFGCLMHYCYTLRQHIMQWTGWNVITRERKPTRAKDYENDTVIPTPRTAKWPIHRSTALAHLPAQLLAEFLDEFFSRIICLPFETLVSRSVAKKFFSKNNPHLYLPFGGGPISSFCRSPSSTTFSNAGKYLSRLGLSIALTCTLDTILFFAAYRTVRHMGVEHFDWGRKGRIGKLIYTEEGMEGVNGRDLVEEEMG